MKIEKAVNLQLKKAYEEWASKLDDSFKTDDYSNPYYCSVSDNWENSNCRIMIVGLEGKGTWCKYDHDDKLTNIKYDNIMDLQILNRLYVEKQLGKGVETYKNISFRKKNLGCTFWGAVNAFAEYGDIVWNNFDKVNKVDLNNEKSSAHLSPSERDQLHKNSILKKEIEITNPNVVVFLGKMDLALEFDFPNDFFKPIGEAVDLFIGEIEGVKYIKMKHPSHYNRATNGKKQIDRFKENIKIINELLAQDITYSI